MRAYRLLGATLVAALFLVPRFAQSQEREDRALLPWDQMNAIANEASGERAKANVLEQVPYHRVRPLSEYGSDVLFRESAVIQALAKEYGFSDVSVESFPGRGMDWQPTVGQLYLVGDMDRKLFDIYDTPVALASRSQNGDVTAEVVNVGSGANASDYEGKDVRGKVVLGSSGTSQLQRLGVFERGAVGVLSYRNVYSIENPDALLSSSVSAEGPDGQPGGFGWSISSRVARQMIDQIDAGRTVTVRSVVQGTEFPGEMEVTHAVIPGDGTSDQTLFITGHAYEGLIKQGANDDNSGVGLTLEMGRAYIKLLEQGVLPRPKRDIHFLWIPEISGTTAWLDAHPEFDGKILANLNFDMEGIQLSTSGSFWVLHRTPDTIPTFVNDVAQSFLEVVGETNRERLRFRGTGYSFSWPVVSQNGSLDPFYIKVDKYYGSSDHVVFLRRGIPAIMFITWPDRWYHTSEDTPDKLDPTQLRRAAVVGIATMAVVAGADDPMAYAVANESYGRGTERVAANQRKGLAYIADASNGPELIEAYKEAKNAVYHQTGVEEKVLLSTAQLFQNPSVGERTLQPMLALLDERAEALVNEISASYRISARMHGLPDSEPPVTELEMLASRTIVNRAESTEGGGRGGRANMSPEDRAALAKVPSHMSGELGNLLGEGMTVLAIRNFVAGEFDPLPLSDLFDYLHAQERAGSITLTERAALGSSQ